MLSSTVASRCLRTETYHFAKRTIRSRGPSQLHATAPTAALTPVRVPALTPTGAANPISVPAAAATAPLVTVSVADRVARVCIKREPVNSMSLQLWTELLQMLLALEGRSDVTAVVFHSGLARSVFTSGNDLTELCVAHTTKQRFGEFWWNQQTFLARLYASPLITVAAIRGQCPAGGCGLALMCDHRIFTEDRGPTIGLNEVALGIHPPKWWMQVRLFTRLQTKSRARRTLMQTGGWPVNS